MRIKTDIPIRINEIRNIVKCTFPKEIKYIEYITTDSREVRPGDLFFSLAKSTLDAIKHSKEAKKNGGYIAAELDLIECNNTTVLNMLLNLAAYYKTLLPCLKSTVAVTGSIGKTTTKELIFELLSQKYNTHATFENQNNALGISYTLLTAPKNTEILVLELGMNHQGEIESLSKAITPDIAVITNITSAHIGNLGSRAAIAKEKLSIKAGMSDNGITIVPYEEALLQSAHNRRTVSTSDPRANFFLFPLEEKSNGSIFDFYSENTVITAQKIKIPGKHILNSVLYALAVCSVLKLSRSQIEEGLSQLSPSSLRQKFLLIGKYKFYDDTYSSSPEAAINMLQVLKMLAPTERSALLGDMLELGKYSEELHYELGKQAHICGLKKLYTFGEFAKTIAQGAIDCGMNPNNIFVNENPNDFKLSAEQIISTYDGELILFKASHALHIEKIIEYIKSNT